MAPHARKKALHRGTFLLVDGAKYDVSNIVHESTEQIPDEISILIQRCKWDDDLYPSVLEIEHIQNNGEFTNIHDRNGASNHQRDSQDESVSSSQEDDDESASSASTSYEYGTDDDDDSSSNDESSSSSTSSSSNVSSGRHLSGDESWNKGHSSLASINWTPAPEKIEILKLMEQSGGRAQVPGAVRVGASALETPRKPPPPLVREESTPGAVHVDGPGVTRNPSGNFSSFKSHGKEDASKQQQFQEYKQLSNAKMGVAPPSGPARKRSSFSIDSYFSNENPSTAEPALWEQQQQQYQQYQQQQEEQDEHDDSWESNQIKATAAAFSDCHVSSPPSEHQRMVQVTHDLELPLHGAHETTIALETGNVVTVVCLVCRATLRCISKAQYVLCPECRCLTPLEETMDATTGGVGLGLLSAFDQSYRVGVS